MASFTAAGTAYANYGVAMIPFFIYYSMFGFQRVGDLVWAFGDSRGKGFMVGATAGRTTLAGEGLQHQDGHSLVLASTVPTCVSYDPAYAYEIAVILQEGIRRMYQQQEDLFYYLTVGNENYVQPAMPEGVEQGILKGIYRYRSAPGGAAVAQLFGSGAILNEALRAQAILAERFGIQTDVWSVTSYNELRREALAVERWNRALPFAGARRGRGAGGGRDRLHEDRGRPGFAMALGEDDGARDRRLRPQRQPPAVAASLRGECRVDRRGDAGEAGA